MLDVFWVWYALRPLLTCGFTFAGSLAPETREVYRFSPDMATLPYPAGARSPGLQWQVGGYPKTRGVVS